MNVHLFKNYYNFSIENIINQKYNKFYKISFKLNKQFISSKKNINLLLIGKLMKKGQSLKKYKLINKYYINYIIRNIVKLSNNNEFKGIFTLNNSFKDLNRVLLWKITKINPLFNIKIIKKKKIVYYLKKLNRPHTVMSWIKSIIKLKSSKFNNHSYGSISGLNPIILTNLNNNNLNTIKLKIYKTKFLKG